MAATGTGPAEAGRALRNPAAVETAAPQQVAADPPSPLAVVRPVARRETMTRRAARVDAVAPRPRRAVGGIPLARATPPVDRPRVHAPGVGPGRAVPGTPAAARGSLPELAPRRGQRAPAAASTPAGAPAGPASAHVLGARLDLRRAAAGIPAAGRVGSPAALAPDRGLVVPIALRTAAGIPMRSSPPGSSRTGRARAHALWAPAALRPAVTGTPIGMLGGLPPDLARVHGRPVLRRLAVGTPGAAREARVPTVPPGVTGAVLVTWRAVGVAPVQPIPLQVARAERGRVLMVRAGGAPRVAGVPLPAVGIPIDRPARAPGGSPAVVREDPDRPGTVLRFGGARLAVAGRLTAGSRVVGHAAIGSRLAVLLAIGTPRMLTTGEVRAAAVLPLAGAGRPTVLSPMRLRIGAARLAGAGRRRVATHAVVGSPAAPVVVLGQLVVVGRRPVRGPRAAMRPGGVRPAVPVGVGGRVMVGRRGGPGRRTSRAGRRTGRMLAAVRGTAVASGAGPGRLPTRLTARRGKAVIVIRRTPAGRVGTRTRAAAGSGGTRRSRPAGPVPRTSVPGVPVPSSRRVRLPGARGVLPPVTPTAWLAASGRFGPRAAIRLAGGAAPTGPHDHGLTALAAPAHGPLWTVGVTRTGGRAARGDREVRDGPVPGGPRRTADGDVQGLTGAGQARTRWGSAGPAGRSPTAWLNHRPTRTRGSWRRRCGPSCGRSPRR